MPADPPSTVSAEHPFRPPNPVVIGLLGGIAAGKSTVAAMFARHGLVHVDADAEARAVAEEPATLAEIGAAFGPAVVAGGRLDRAAMAERVFTDAAARARLEAIMHPRIRARILAALAAARARGRSVLLDAPLLLEHGLIAECHHVVFVDADEGTRAARARDRGWAAGELARRQAAQAPLAEKMARASRVIHNDRGLDETARQVAEYLDELARR